MQRGAFQAGDHSLDSTPAPSGFATPSSASGRIGDRRRAIGAGDWYARNMYMQGSRQYEYHLKTYGHPSQFGYKDTIPLWKAERFDPKALVRLYREAGAKYFVSMGVHCDNFDLWNSRNRRWNSVKWVPTRDIVGEWREAARGEGLRFGVSEHVWGSYNWWRPTRAPTRRVPTRACLTTATIPPIAISTFRRTRRRAKPGPSRATSRRGGSASGSCAAQDLIDQHQPDLYYEDGGIPFGRWGRSLVAHYYNQSLRWHHGKVDVVYTGKRRSELRDRHVRSGCRARRGG